MAREETFDVQEKQPHQAPHWTCLTMDVRGAQGSAKQDLAHAGPRREHGPVIITSCWPVLRLTAWTHEIFTVRGQGVLGACRCRNARSSDLKT